MVALSWNQDFDGDGDVDDAESWLAHEAESGGGSWQSLYQKMKNDRPRLADLSLS